MLFTELGLPEEISRAAAEAGYTEATAIQAEAIPVLLGGRDLVACSQTGTGKTAAFAMPLLAKIDLDKKTPQLVVLAPTRELAIQVAEAFEQYGSQLKKLRVLSVFGGAAYQPQLSALHRGVHVVVGTPGRLIDHVKSGALDLSSISSLVLDEADEMLRMGFIDDVKYILSQIPDERQIALFSATMPGPIRDIADKHLNDPHSITVERSQKVAHTIRQQHVVVTPKHKVEILTRILELEETDGVIVFVKTKIGTVELSERLAARGLNVAPLNGDIPQAQRTRTVEKLKSGEINVLVATDVAARGLDVDRISHVINYDMPHDEEAYVHRIGRTGRAGREGAAILLVTPAQRHIVRSLQKATGQTITQVEGPSIEAINEKRTAEFKQKITLALESRQLPMFQAMLEQLCDETGKPAIEVAAAVAAMHIGKRSFFAKPIEDDFSGSRRDSFESRARGDRPSRDREFAPRDNRRDDRSGDSRSGEGRGFDRQPSRGGAGGRDSVPMQRYRVEVGREHGVQPGNLVGAIANESGLSGSEIGRIDIYDQYSIVGLPEGMPPSVFDSLNNAWVSGRQLRLSLAEGGSSRPVRTGKPFDRKSAVRAPGAHRATAVKAPFKKAKKKATS
jgi:ATP-dependent RNA helicase DeaD